MMAMARSMVISRKRTRRDLHSGKRPGLEQGRGKPGITNVLGVLGAQSTDTWHCKPRDSTYQQGQPDLRSNARAMPFWGDGYLDTLAEEA